MSDEYCSTCILNVVQVDYLICIKPCEVESALGITPTMATVRIGDATQADSTAPLQTGDHARKGEHLRREGSDGETAIPDNIGYKKRWPAVAPDSSRTPIEDAEARQRALMLRRAATGALVRSSGPDRKEYPNGYAIPQSARFSDRGKASSLDSHAGSPEDLPGRLNAAQIDQVRAKLVELGVDNPDFLTAKLAHNAHFIGATRAFGIEQVLEILNANDGLESLASAGAPLSRNEDTPSAE